MQVLQDRGLRVEIPVDSAGEGSLIVGHCYAPDPAAAAALPAPIWIFALHGAGEDWTYMDKTVPGHEDEPYSFAAFMNERGVGLIAIDALGCGESEFPFDGSELSLEKIAYGHDEAARAFRERITSGTLVPGAGPVENLFYVGLGHSGGAGVTILQQGFLGTFDGIVVLSMPADDFLYPNSGQENLNSAIQTNEKGMIFIAERPEQSIAGAFTPDTPQDVRDAFPPGTPFPPSHTAFMKNGTLAPYARKVTVPVLTVFGEIDLAGSPLEEQNRFGSKDATAYVQPGCYHHIWAAPEPARLQLMTAIYNWAWSRAKYRN
jgi:alpha-beta hydrolase superfamily lysophospholipase